jgi:hypothetical protein
MDKAKLIRVGLMVVAAVLGALIKADVLPAETWGAIAAALAAWQVPAIGHTSKES